MLLNIEIEIVAIVITIYTLCILLFIAPLIVITFVVDVILLLVPFFNCRLPLLFSSPILFFCVSLIHMRIENGVMDKMQSKMPNDSLNMIVHLEL